MNNRTKFNPEQFEASRSRATLSSDRLCNTARARESSARAFDVHPDPALRHRLIHVPAREPAGIPLRVMKFGGTSVGDASSIRKVVEIVRAASKGGHIAVVVSAMSGVTSKLVEIAVRSQVGEWKQVLSLLQELKERHETALHGLIPRAPKRNNIEKKLQGILRGCEQVCREVSDCRILTPEECDAISGVGERLSVPLVAAALAETGVPCEPIEATELLVTDEHHGAAEPKMDRTREKCQSRLRPLLRENVVPVITGFIGATENGRLTTLGRNSSDFSATILGAAMGADLVEIWTDVDGVLTADPKVVHDARMIPEISFREAAEMASCGAKVLHSKCLRPLIPSAIPLRICNTFAPDRPGTKIVHAPSSNGGHAKAVAAADDFAIVTLSGIDEASVQNFWGRVDSVSKAVEAEIRLKCQGDSKNDIGFVVSAFTADRFMEAIRQEFASDLSKEDVDSITLDTGVAVVTAVGHNICGNSEFLARVFDALTRKNIRVIGVGRDYSETSFSFVVTGKHMNSALSAVHGEFLSGSMSLPSAAFEPV